MKVNTQKHSIKKRNSFKHSSKPVSLSKVSIKIQFNTLGIINLRKKIATINAVTFLHAKFIKD
jgi:hypothetical protein